MSDAKVEDRAGDRIEATDLGMEMTPSIFVEVDEDGEQVTAIWVEDLAFHLEMYPEHMAELTDREGQLSQEGRVAVFEAMLGLLPSQEMSEPLEDGFSFTLDEGSEWEEPSVAFAMSFRLPRYRQTTYAELADWTWPFYATITNVTDPGTWNSPYLMRKAVETLHDNRRRQAAQKNIDAWEFLQSQVGEMPMAHLTMDQIRERASQRLPFKTPQVWGCEVLPGVYGIGTSPLSTDTGEATVSAVVSFSGEIIATRATAFLPTIRSMMTPPGEKAPLRGI